MQETFYRRECEICGKVYFTSSTYRKYCTPTYAKYGCGAFAKQFTKGNSRGGEHMEFGLEEAVEILKRQDYKCNICGEPLEIYKELSKDHIVPWSKKGKHHKDNIAFTHWKCNLMKGALEMEELIDIARKIAQYHTKI